MFHLSIVVWIPVSEEAIAPKIIFLDGVSERFQGSGLDKRGIKRLLTYQVLRGRWVWVTIARTTIELQGNTARAIVDVVMSRSGKGIPLKELLPERATVYRIDFQLAREESDWKVTAAQWAPISLEDAIDGPASGIEASD